MSQNNPAEHNKVIDEVAWAILQALHTNINENKRPMSWSDCSEEQQKRIFSAAQAAITAFLENKAKHSNAGKVSA